jgi:hypothetical protein
MGAVYEAVDTRLHNTVAIKQLTLSGSEADRAFEHEARLLASLRHPALVVVIDYFVDEDAPVLVMQYIEGEDLARALERRGVIPVDGLVRWAHAVLDALIYLHDHVPPVLHRDIKPSNLKCTPSGEIVLLDFGLSKGRLDAHTTVTEDRSLFGFTLKYAPLEQILGRGTDRRTDLYGLGATLYHLATGTQPASSLARSQAIRNGEPDPLVDPRLPNPQLSKWFAGILTRAMALEPADRYESAGAMKTALLVNEFVPASSSRPSEPSTGVARRVDAATPSQPIVGKQTDLIVQVRFPDSPLLGLEDWPTRRRPAQIEQASEPFHLVHPVDPATGERRPARLLIKVVAPDFSIEGQAQLLIEVTPREYSKRLAFLLTPKRAGYCRINVEVYAPDALYLGTIAVEAEAVAEGLAEPIVRVASLVFGVFSRKAPTVPAATSGHLTDDGFVRAELPRPSARPIVEETLADSDEQLQSSLPIRVRPANRLGRNAMVIGPGILIAVIGAGVLFMQNRATDIGPSPAGPSAAVDAPSAAQQVRVPAELPFPADTALDEKALSRPRGEPALAPALLRLTASNLSDVNLTVALVQRSSASRLRVTLFFMNGGRETISISIDYSRTKLSDEKGTGHVVVRDALGTSPDGTFSAIVAPGAQVAHWIEFEVPDTATGAVTATLVPTEGRSGARFPAFSFELPAR